MITIPIKTKKDAMGLFNIFQKKERVGLEAAVDEGIITREESLRIAADRAADRLRKFLDSQKKTSLRKAIDK